MEEEDVVVVEEVEEEEGLNNLVFVLISSIYLR